MWLAKFLLLFCSGVFLTTLFIILLMLFMPSRCFLYQTLVLGFSTGVSVFPSSQNVESRSTTLSEKELLDYPHRDFVLSTEFLLPRFSVSALAVLGLLPLPCCRRHFTFPSITNSRLMELSISYCKVLVAMLF